MSVRINKEDPNWERLYRLWKEQPGEPGIVIIPGGESYRVLRPSDEDIIFEKMSGFDEMYSSLTKGMPG